MATTLIVPGLHSSGPAHWQSWFEARIPDALRVVQADWTEADLPKWSARVRRNIALNPGRHFIVAHSFGVLAAVQAATDHPDRIAGALLVAPADPAKFAVETYLPQLALPFPSVVVASTNDAWMTLDRAAHWAERWGSEFVNLGAAGHINAASGFGPWSEGLALLDRVKRTPRVHDRAAHAESISSSARRVLAGRAKSSISSARLRRSEPAVLRQAARLLEDAGWLVRPPQYTGHVAGA